MGLVDEDMFSDAVGVVHSPEFDDRGIMGVEGCAMGRGK